MPVRPRIAIIGAGNIGGELAGILARKQLGNVVLLDLPERESLAKGKALDLEQDCAIQGYDAHISGTSAWAECEDASVVIVTAGIPRKPGMSRDDLLSVNLKIVRPVAEQIRRWAKGAFVIVLSNPLDAMVYEMKRVTGFPRERVVGMAGVLDSARLQLFLARELGTSVKDVRAMVLGGHGDTMVPVTSYCTVDGIPVRQMITQEQLSQIVRRTAEGGGEIVKLMGTSAYWAPARSAVTMAEAYLKDEKRLLPCAVYCQGEYGFHDLYIGLPAVIGGGGMERIVSIELSPEERGALERSAAAVRELTAIAQRL